jgi:membrane protease subunit (stomatin/prohibitin family)
MDCILCWVEIQLSALLASLRGPSFGNESTVGLTTLASAAVPAQKTAEASSPTSCASPTHRFCVHCGTARVQDARFCGYCGQAF